jgi:RNA polymerase sigma factor (sigma-70 family)
MGKAIHYGGQQVLVSNEVAEFLESDERRQAAQDRSDRRHLSKSDFETVSVAQKSINPHCVEDVAFRNLSLEKLRKVIAVLSDDERMLIWLYFYMEMSMDGIEKHFGISKMAVSKRLKKLYTKMRDLL